MVVSFICVMTLESYVNLLNVRSLFIVDYFIYQKVLDNRFGPATGLTFASWMAFAIPVMSVNLILSWAWLYFQSWVTEKRRKKKERVLELYNHR